jgi:putative hemolysin
MIDAERILQETYPDFKAGKHKTLIVKTLRKLLHEDDFNTFIQNNQHLRGFAFLDKLLGHFQFSYQVSYQSVNNIPAEGRLVIVANHPIGTLDGLALLKLIRTVRPDVKIVANRVLNHMTALNSLFHAVPVLSKKNSLKTAYQDLILALGNEEAVIFFPAGEVSRITAKGIRDSKWQSGFLKLAKKTWSPVLPVNIEAKNSALFYALSALYKPLGTFMLVNEMFNKNCKEIKFHIGAPIPPAAFCNSQEKNAKLGQRFRKQVINLGKKNKISLFETETAISHPADARAIKKALSNALLLGETRDAKKIFLYDFQDDCPVMHEIARLRELTFRSVEEGTGLALDLDKFDSHYRHIVLWDDEDLEIAGAYRIGEGDKIMARMGVEGFYTHTLFDLNTDFAAYLPASIELGRSFVQPKYWGQHSLEYLWYGIGAYLRERPDIKYLFGPVSLSGAYPQEAKELIVAFYNQQFGNSLPQIKARSPFQLSEASRQFALAEFNADYPSCFKVLNSELKRLGVKVPTLYKQYVELCIDRGCHFISFNVDSEFSDCIDSLILVEIDKIAPKKKQRYINAGLAA